MNIGPNLTSLSSEAVAETWDKGGATLGASRQKSDVNSSRFYALRFLAGFSVVVTASAAAWPYLPRRYEAAATVILHPTDLQSSSDSVQFMRQPLDEGAVQSEIDQIASPKLAALVVAQHSLATDPEFAGRPKLWFLPGATQGAVTEADLRQRLLKHLSVSKERHSNTVRFGFTSSDPLKSAALTDTLLKAYLVDQLEAQAGKLRVETKEGPVKDSSKMVSPNSLAIPYAEPPVGDLRWRPPKKHAPWTNVLEATSYAPICAQIVMLGAFAGPANNNEDCL
jgi:hypothetical protein